MTIVTDLTNCDREPIHIPGRIQGHGFLIAIDGYFTIVCCSENISHFLPVTAISLLDKPIQSLESFLQKENGNDLIFKMFSPGQKRKGFEPENPYPIQISGNPFNLIITPQQDCYLLEFEPEISDLKSDIHRIIGNSISLMLSHSRLSNLLRESAEEIQKIIGYDRVMIYKFHKDGHGEVVAEVKNVELEPLMGLHYPASDIPKQARELYKINLTRLIANVDTKTSEIIASTNSHQGPLDLTHSVLRAVSPIHIQYLKNMGVISSFSISLMYRDELWGLVACHNYSPRFINYKEREAAKLVGQVLSAALSFRQAEEDGYINNILKIAVDTLTKQLLRYNSIEEALFRNDASLLDATGASAAALFFDNKLYTAGDAPDEEFILGLIDYLNKNNESQLFETDRLPLIYPPALNCKTKASGVLSCRLSKGTKECILWFRPEVITTVKWAGNPDKPAELNENGLSQNSPRKSFEVWSQTVQYTSTPWKNEDLKSALQVKEEIASAISRKATEIRLMNEKLNEAYDELDAFSYTISHDLKNPLTSIKGYLEILKEFFELEPKAKEIVNRILNGANKMQAMIQEVLNYSRVGKSKIIRKRVNMNVILSELKEELLNVNKYSKPEIMIGKTPDIYGDETMIMQVFSNLISNAVKYSSRHQHPIVTVNGEDTGTEIRYVIRDNGIGVKPENQERIFELFARSDEAKDYEGTGVGLSIVKRIIEKHGGNIWLESELNSGSAFYVSFTKPVPELILQ